MDRSISTRLMELGLLPGTQVTVVRIAPMGCPMELRVRDSSLSIRRAEAAGVSVHLLPESGVSQQAPS